MIIIRTIDMSFWGSDKTWKGIYTTCRDKYAGVACGCCMGHTYGGRFLTHPIPTLSPYFFHQFIPHFIHYCAYVTFIDHCRMREAFLLYNLSKSK